MDHSRLPATGNGEAGSCPPCAYALPAILLHWVSALLIIGALVIGWIMTDIPGLTPAKLKYFSWHKWIGFSVLLLWLPRVLCRLAYRSPPLPAGMDAWQRRVAAGTHWALYGLLLAVPLSGLLYSQAAGVPVRYLGMVQIPALIAPDPQMKVLLKSLHLLLNYSLIGLLAAHVLAALMHQFIDRDQLLARMNPFGPRGQTPPSHGER